MTKLDQYGNSVRWSNKISDMSDSELLVCVLKTVRPALTDSRASTSRGSAHERISERAEIDSECTVRGQAKKLSELEKQK